MIWLITLIAGIFGAIILTLPLIESVTPYAGFVAGAMNAAFAVAVYSFGIRKGKQKQ